MTSIGMNLAAVSYSSTEEPFIDRMKTAGAWGAADSAGTSLTSSLTLDANGYPTNLANVAKLTNAIAVDPLGADPIDRYVVTYDGTAKLSVTNAKIISQTNGEVVFELTNATAKSVLLTFTQLSAGDPISDVHVVRADQVDLFNAGEMFNPDFVAQASQWDVLRFMGWGGTNSLQDITWDSRSQLSDMTWASDQNPGGVPLEVMVQLANEAHTDMWYNVPTKAGDDFVTKAMTYIRDHLDPSLKVHVEYSNEVWNSGFAAYKYAQDQANALWGVDANKDGAIDPVTKGTALYYGYRSAQIAGIAHTVFGTQSDARLVDVLAGQTSAGTTLTNYILPGVLKAGVGSVKDLFKDYAVAPYIGGQLGANNTADETIVLGWARSGAAGIDAALHEIEYGGALSTNLSLAAYDSFLAKSETAVKAAGLNLVTYEGGVSLTSYTFDAAVQDEVAAFFAKVVNDPRMGAIYTKLVAEVAAHGGTEFTAFTDVGVSSKWGYWGALDSVYSTSSPRHDALLAINALHALTHPLTSVGAIAVATLTATDAGGVLNGAAGDDIIYAGRGNDLINGGDGNDHVIGFSSSLNASGQLIESDYYSGGAGSDTIDGGAGNDHIYGNSIISVAGSVDGADSLSGGAGNDYIQGNAGADTIDGGDGNDRIYGGADADSLMGGAGNDYVQGNKGNDTVLGGDGSDTLHGGADNDSVNGGAGDDQVFGDAGDDTLVGGAGVDVLTGGAGSDRFVFGAHDAAFVGSNANAPTDEITDFASGADKIMLGFQVAQVFQGSATTMASAADYAAQVLNSHAGAHDVAAVTVGADTYLFYDSTGAGGALDSAIKVDHIAATSFTMADFV